MSQKVFALFQGSTNRGSTNQGITVLTWKTKDVLRTYQTLGNFHVLILLFLKNSSKWEKSLANSFGDESTSDIKYV